MADADLRALGAGDLSVYRKTKVKAKPGKRLPRESAATTTRKAQEGQRTRRKIAAQRSPWATKGASISNVAPDNTITGSIYSGLENLIAGGNRLFGASERDAVQEGSRVVGNIRTLTDDVLGLQPVEKSLRKVITDPGGAGVGDYINAALTVVPAARTPLRAAGRTIAGSAPGRAVGRAVDALAASRPLSVADSIIERFLPSTPMAQVERRMAQEAPVAARDLAELGGPSAEDLAHVRVPAKRVTGPPRVRSLPRSTIDLEAMGAPDIGPMALTDRSVDPRFRAKGGQWAPAGVRDHPDYSFGIFKNPEEMTDELIGDTQYADDEVRNWARTAFPSYFRKQYGTASDPMRDLTARERSHMDWHGNTPETYWDDVRGQALYSAPLGNIMLPRHSSEIQRNIAERAASNAERRRMGMREIENWSSTIDPQAQNRAALLETEPRLGTAMMTDPIHMLSAKGVQDMQLAQLLNRATYAAQPTTDLRPQIRDALPLYLPRDVEQNILSNIDMVAKPPREAAIDYAKMSKMTLPQVSERVGNYNRWKVAEAERRAQAGLRAEYEPDLGNAAVEDFKVYPSSPGSNSNRRWVQIRKPDIPEGELPPGYWVDDVGGGKGGIIRDETGRDIAYFQNNPDSRAYAYADAAKKYAAKPVTRALGAEGAFMNHCVGGYCEPVMEGNTNIYSLRGREGMPEVTIETKPSRGAALSILADEDPELGDLYNDLFYGATPRTQRVDESRNDYFTRWVEENHPDMVAKYPDAFSYTNRIEQIKGPGNHAPLAETHPYIRDFLSSNKPWAMGSNEEDLARIGARLLPGQKFVSTDEYAEGLMDYAKGSTYDPLPYGAHGPIDPTTMAKYLEAQELGPRIVEGEWDTFAPYFDKFTGFAVGGRVRHKSGCGCAACDFSVGRNH